MRVLLTNDDGVYAEGLQTLRRRLEKERGLEIFVVAPERERSASSHAITLHKPLYVHRVETEDFDVPTWSVSGTPADCTKIGVLALLDRPPDLVVSGINRGPNLGMDVLYSGTVSAAIEGAILGIPSIAVSLGTFQDADYGTAADFMASFLRKAEKEGLKPGALININVPALEADRLAGVAITRLGHRYYTDVFHPRRDPRGRTYYWLAGEVRDSEEGIETDIGALERNLVSITPLHLRLTDEELASRMRGWLSDIRT